MTDLPILFVMAAQPEYGPALRARIQPLMTGIGPIEAAVQLTAALARWLDDDAGRAAAGQAARAHVTANHAIEGEARAIVDVYRSLL